MATNTNFNKLYDKIRLAIYLTEYPPGAALREEELAAEFGVSRTPIRRVLHQLEFEGLVINQRGVGSIVTTVDIKELRDVYAFRLHLTKLIGELSFPRITEENIAVLENLKSKVEAMESNYAPKELALLYLEFHNEMMKLVTNQTLRRVSDQLFHQTARVWLQILPELSWEEEVQAIEEELRDVIKSLKANDIQTMAAVRRNHLAMVVHRVNDYLGRAYIE